MENLNLKHIKKLIYYKKTYYFLPQNDKNTVCPSPNTF